MNVSSAQANFPVGHIPAAVPISSQDLAALFNYIDSLRPLLASEEAQSALTGLELKVEEMAGV